MSFGQRVVNFFFYVGLFGGICGVATQSFMFRAGNFSEKLGVIADAVYIPLGKHGVYTSKLIGLTWYGASALFFSGLLVALIGTVLQRRS